MEKTFVRAVFDLDCDWEGLPPNYRVYVNDELFTERSWIWTENYLEENLQIQAGPGRYTVKIEPVRPCLAEFRVSNYRVDHGPAHWVSPGQLEITHEST